MPAESETGDRATDDTPGDHSLPPTALAVLNNTTLSGTEAAAALGWSPARVRASRSRLGISLRAAKHEHDDGTLRVLMDESLSHRQAAEQLGITRSKVRTRRAKLGIDRAVIVAGPSIDDRSEAVLRDLNLTHRQAARRLELAPAQVKTARARRGISRNQRRRPPADVVVTLVEEGRSDSEIASAFGVRPDTVRVWRAELGRYREAWAAPAPAELDQLSASGNDIDDPNVLRRLVAEGLTNIQIGAALNVSTALVKSRLQRAGITRDLPTPIDVDDITRLKSQGLTDGEIATVLRTSASRVYRTRRRAGVGATIAVVRPSHGEVLDLYSQDDGVDKLRARFDLDHDAAEAWVESARGSFTAERRPTAEELATFVADGLSDDHIAERYGVAAATAANWRRRMGITRTPTTKRPGDDTIRSLVRQGTSDDELAEEFEVTVATAAQWRRKAGIRRSPGSNHRQSHRRSGRPPAATTYRRPDEEELRLHVTDGLSDEQIGTQYGVAPGTVATWRRKARILRPRTSNRPDAEVVAALVLDGATDQALAERFDVSLVTAANWRRAAGISRSRWAPTRRISELAEGGMEPAAIADHIGVAVTTVLKHLRHGAWSREQSDTKPSKDRWKRPGAQSNPRWGRCEQEEQLAIASGIPAATVYGVTDAELKSMSRRNRSGLASIVQWLVNNDRWLQEVDEIAVAAYVLASYKAGESLATIGDHLMALRSLQKMTGRPVTIGAGHAVIRRIRVQDGVGAAPIAPVTPLRVLADVWAWDWTTSPRNIARVASRTLLAAHPELRHPMARRGRFRSDFVTEQADSAVVELPATERRAAVTVTVRRNPAANGEPWRCPLAALQRLGSVTDPTLILTHVGADSFQRELIADLASRVWLAVTFQNALRSGTAGKATLLELQRGHCAVHAKGKQREFAVGHTLGHTVCPACSLADLIEALPTGFDHTVPLADLASRSRVRSWLTRQLDPITAQAPRVSPNTLRRSMASIVYARTRDLFAVAHLLQHDSDLKTTARYVASLPDIGDLTDPEYSLDRWESYLQGRSNDRAATVSRPSHDEVIAETLDHLQAAGHPSVGPDGRAQAVASRRQYNQFCDGSAPFEFPPQWGLDPEEPRSLQRFVVHYLVQRRNAVATIEAKVAHILNALQPGARAQFEQAVRPVLVGARRQERIERRHVQRAPVATREMAAVAADHLLTRGDLMGAGRIILGWNAALRTSSPRGIENDAIARLTDRAILTVRVATKRRGSNRHTYKVTLTKQDDTLCPLAWLDMLRDAGRSIDFETDRSADYRRWRRERALVAEAHPSWGVITPMSLRHGRAVEHYTEHCDLIGTQMLLGHQSPQQTMTYLVNLSARVRSAVTTDITEKLGLTATASQPTPLGIGLRPLTPRRSAP